MLLLPPGHFPPFSHSPPWFNGRSNEKPTRGRGRHKAGAKGGWPAEAGFPSPGQGGVEAAVPGAKEKRGFFPPFSCPSSPLFLSLPPPFPVVHLACPRSQYSSMEMDLMGEGECVLICGVNNEGWCGGVYGCSLCVSKPLTNTNAGIKGQRRRRQQCSQLTHRLEREGEREREAERERRRDTHTHTHSQSKEEGAPRLLGCTLHTEL